MLKRTGCWGVPHDGDKIQTTRKQKPNRLSIVSHESVFLGIRLIGLLLSLLIGAGNISLQVSNYHADLT
jgi:hypothetical protein